MRGLLRREICCLQHGETESNVWNTFVWSCPTWPSRWGMRISTDGPRLKSCQAVCDECMRGKIYSSLSRDADCLGMWSWRESRVTKIWGSGHDHGFVLFLFATTGFHIARSGILWTPNIHVIRGLYQAVPPCCCRFCTTKHCMVNVNRNVTRQFPHVVAGSVPPSTVWWMPTGMLPGSSPM